MNASEINDATAQAVVEEIPAGLVARFGDLVERLTGLFLQNRPRDLIRAAGAAARELGYPDAVATMRAFTAAPPSEEHLEILAKHITTGETYFFRDPELFGAIENVILPEIIRTRRGADQRLRIWSAGCCTGEEAYSLAIILRRSLPDIDQWHITILATDINPDFLSKARTGIYTKWSFRSGGAKYQESCFIKIAPNQFEILPEYKRMVTFRRLNLIEPIYPAFASGTNAMDLILCRNVLMYFSEFQARNLAARLETALADDGWLVPSPTDASHAIFRGLEPVSFPQAMAYRKTTAHSRKLDGPQAAPAIPHTSPSGTVIPRPTPDRPIAPPAPPVYRDDRESIRAGMTLFEQGNYAEASEFFAASSQDPPTLAMLARCDANRGRLGAALEWCDKALAADKVATELHYLRGSILEEQGRGDDAVAAFKRALYLDPHFVLAEFALGMIMRRMAQHEQAARHFDIALEELRRMPREQILPETAGMTAGSLVEMIQSVQDLMS